MIKHCPEPKRIRTFYRPWLLIWIPWHSTNFIFVSLIKFRLKLMVYISCQCHCIRRIFLFTFWSYTDKHHFKSAPFLKKDSFSRVICVWSVRMGKLLGPQKTGKFVVSRPKNIGPVGWQVFFFFQNIILVRKWSNHCWKPS